MEPVKAHQNEFNDCHEVKQLGPAIAIRHCATNPSPKKGYVMRFMSAVASLFVALFVSQLTAPTAFALSPRTSQNEVLTKVWINGELQPKMVGMLRLDFVQDKIELEVWNDVCGAFQPHAPGMVRCMAMPVLQDTISVPLEERLNDCGTSVYSGVLDQLPVDGPRTSISVQDHTARLCENYVPSLIMVDATVLVPPRMRPTEPINYHLQK